MFIVKFIIISHKWKRLFMFWAYYIGDVHGTDNYTANTYLYNNRQQEQDMQRITQF